MKDRVYFAEISEKLGKSDELCKFFGVDFFENRIPRTKPLQTSYIELKVIFIKLNYEKMSRHDLVWLDDGMIIVKSQTCFETFEM